MKRRNNITAAGIAAGVMLAAAAFFPGCNMNEKVYGPPEYFTKEYDPDDNINEHVYGPPPAYTEDDSVDNDTNVDEYESTQSISD